MTCLGMEGPPPPLRVARGVDAQSRRANGLRARGLSAEIARQVPPSRHGVELAWRFVLRSLVLQACAVW